jgi:Family of unknown function (DUF6174)
MGPLKPNLHWAMLLGAVALLPPRAHADVYAEGLAKWKAAAPAHYVFREWHYGYTSFYYQIEVDSGKVIKASPGPGIGAIPQAQWQGHSIDSLYGLIQRYRTADAARIYTSYENGFGLPVEVYVDPLANVIDEEFTITIQGFKALPASDTAWESWPTDALNANWSKWKGLRPDAYGYRSEADCFCLPETITVEAQKEKVVRAASSARTLDTLPEKLQGFSIDSVFAKLANANSRRPYRMDVIYDSQYGYPLTYYVDQYENGEDDEVRFYVREFRILTTAINLPKGERQSHPALRGGGRYAAPLFAQGERSYEVNGATLRMQPSRPLPPSR